MAKSYRQAIHEAIDFSLSEFPNAKIDAAIEAVAAIVQELERNKRKYGVKLLKDRTRYRLA